MEIAQMIEDDNYQNMSTVLFKHLQDQSKALKATNPEVSL